MNNPLQIFKRSFSIRNILILALVFSLLNTYSYISFRLNMSLGVGYAYVAKSLALSYNFNVNEYWGNSGVDVIDVGENKYLAYPFFASIMMAIPYFILQAGYFLYTNIIGPINGDLSIVLESLSLSSTNTLAYIGIGYLIYKALQHYRFETSKIKWVLISYLFGSIALNYSVSYLNHVFSAFFIFAAFYTTIYSTHKAKHLISGSLIGMAFLTELPTVLFSLAFLTLQIYEFKYHRNLQTFIKRNLQFALPVFISILILGLYQYINFGNPFLHSERIIYLQNIERGIETVSFEQGVLFGLWGFYLSPLKGLFLISPILILSFLGIKKYFDIDPKAAILSTSYVIIISLIYAKWSDCFGATPFGPRYMTSAIPFLFLISAFSISNKNIFRLYKTLTAYGIYICVVNMLDGLPSGTWFGQCRIYEYGSLHKANDFLKNLYLGKAELKSVIYRYMTGKALY